MRKCVSLANILGNLSGTGNNIADSKEGFIKIFSEAQRIGYDSSKHAQEMRKFGENVSDIVYKLGVTGQEGIQGIAQFQAAATTDQTSRGAQAAQSATEQLAQNAKSNPLSRIRRGQGLLKLIPKASTADIEAFQGMDERTITPDSDFVQGLVEENPGTNAKDLSKQLKKLLTGSDVGPGTDKAQDRLAEIMEKAGGDVEKAKLIPGYKSALKNAQTTRAQFGVGAEANTPEARSMAVARARQQIGYGLGGEDIPEGLLPAKPFNIDEAIGDRVSDQSNASEATQQGMVNEQIKQFSSDFSAAFSKIINATHESLEKFMTIQEKVKDSGDVVKLNAEAWDSLNKGLRDNTELLNNRGAGGANQGYLPPNQAPSQTPVNNQAPDKPFMLNPPK